MKKILAPLNYSNTNSNAFKKTFAKRMLVCASFLVLLFMGVVATTVIENGFDFASAGMSLASVLPFAITTETKKFHEERTAKILKMKEISDLAKAENREMTADEDKLFDKLDTEAEALAERIKRTNKITELNSEEEERLLKLAGEGKEPSKEMQAELKAAEGKAFSKFLAFGLAGLNEDQRKIMRTLESRAQSVGTTTAGGFLVPEGFMAELTKAMLAFGGVREVARILNTTTGNDIPWPNMNDTATKGRLLAENTQVTETALVFGSKTLKAYKYSSDSVLVSSELLNDSGINVDSIIIDALAERIARITNEHFTTGDNSAKPQGVVTFSTAGKTAAAEGSVTFSEIIDLVHSVDPAYRKNAKFMFNDATLKAIKKLSIGSSDARPLWDAGIFRSGVPPTIDGYGYVINQDMASMAADAKFMLFGDFSKYIIRDVQGYTLKRLVERYADYDQVGFFAFSRHDGRGLSSDAPIKHMINANT